MSCINQLKRRKKQKIPLKRKTGSFYSPPQRFASYSVEGCNEYSSHLLSPAGKIFNEIHDIKPFSVMDKSRGIDEKLNEIFLIHKQKMAKEHQSNKRFQTKKVDFRTHNLKDQCIEIIKKHHTRKNSKSKTSGSHLFVRRVQQSQQTYDDMESEIANQLINESQKQKRAFQSTMKRLHSLIENAEVEYVKKNELDISLKDIKKFGLKKFANKDRVCTQYSEQYTGEGFQPSNIDLNKKDFHTWLRSSKKLANATNIEDDNPNALKGLHKIPPLVKNTNDFLYKRYFKKSNERKNILTATLEVA